ncbi:uncharacterized protein LOC135375510 isoform X2 [Ornithodoros turicata]|uniref:uncharacterized protein LOC135375510 isoform X2 n=1 Tax=Ornithodoros turicata TaxID=34597 RepID=UPI00313977F4
MRLDMLRMCPFQFDRALTISLLVVFVASPITLFAAAREQCQSIDTYIDSILNEGLSCTSNCLEPASVREFPVNITVNNTVIEGGFRNGIVTGLTSAKRKGSCTASGSDDGELYTCELSLNGTFINYYGFVKRGYNFRPNHYCFMGLAIKNSTVKAQLSVKDDAVTLKTLCLEEVAFEFTHVIDDNQKGLFENRVKPIVLDIFRGLLNSTFRDSLSEAMQGKTV